MKNKDFDRLKDQLEDAMDELERLQKIYIGQTGNRFVAPLRLGPRTKAPQQSTEAKTGKCRCPMVFSLECKKYNRVDSSCGWKELG